MQKIRLAIVSIENSELRHIASRMSRTVLDTVETAFLKALPRTLSPDDPEYDAFVIDGGEELVPSQRQLLEGFAAHVPVMIVGKAPYFSQACLQVEHLTSAMLEMFVQQVSHCKAQQERLNEARAFTRLIVSEVPYLVLTVGSKGRIVAVNPAMIAASGYCEDELVGRFWRDVVFEDAGTTNRSRFVVGDEDDISFESRLRTKEGELRDIHWNILGRHLRRPGREDVFFILSGKDVTEQERQRLQQHNREKLESLGVLAGGVAHEINNLLQPIHLAAEVLSAKIQSPELEKLTQTIIRNSARAGRIVEDILAFSHHGTPQNHRTDLKAALQDMMPHLSQRMPEEITLKADISAARGFIKISGQDLERVIDNLCSNAAHAMNGRGVIRLTAETQNDTARAASLGIRTGPYAVLTVQDEGPGMAPELLAHIFTPFYTTKPIGEGTGLGLPIVHNLVKSGGGAIDVNSAPGTGTRFRIYLPLVP